MPIAKPDNHKTMQDLLSALNLDPSLLAGFNPDYVESANNLYQGLAGQYAGLDTEEGYAKTDYERGIQENLANQALATRAMKDKLASRGILDSSAGMEQLGLLGKEYETRGSDLGTTRDRALSNISGRRLGFENDYTQQLDTLNRGLRGQATGYVEGKAREENDRVLKQQQSDILTGLNNQQTAAINQQIPAYTPPAIDMSALTAYLANRPVPSAAPPQPQKPVNPYATAANPYLADPFGLNRPAPPKPTLASAVAQVKPPAPKAPAPPKYNARRS